MAGIQAIKRLEDRTEWELGCCSVKSWHDRRDTIRVYCQQYIWKRDEKPTIEMINGSADSGYWWSQITPSAARELAAALIAAADFHKDFKPGLEEAGITPQGSPPNAD